MGSSILKLTDYFTFKAISVSVNNFECHFIVRYKHLKINKILFNVVLLCVINVLNYTI